jgi:hypothetical protein
MTADTPDTAPVNPLTGELTTITVHYRTAPDGKAEVLGRIVVPGLALTPALRDNPKQPARYSLTHTPTGLAVIPGVCGVHARKGAEAATSVDVDWTIPDAKQMVAAIKTRDGFMEALALIRQGCSSRWCTDGDGPKPQSAEARCLTCGWQWDEWEDGGWPLTREEATAKATDHRCDPETEIRLSDTGEWAPPRTFRPDTPPAVDVAGTEAVTG